MAKASTYAEYVALSEAMSELMSIREIMKIFNINLDDNLVKIYKDNSGMISIEKYGNITKNFKHIEVHYHYVHECLKVWRHLTTNTATRHLLSNGHGAGGGGSMRISPRIYKKKIDVICKLLQFL